MADFTTSDGAHLDYSDEGSGDPVVLIGGFAMGLGAWRLQRDHLASSHRVLAFDRRWHGASDRPSNGHRLARHAMDLRELLVGLDLDDVAVVGASMGASVIWAYCDLFGTERLGCIVTIDQTPKMVNDDDWSLGFYDLTWPNVHEFVAKFPDGRQPFHQMPGPDVLQLLLADRTDVSFDDLRPLLRDHTMADWRDVLPLIDVPLLAITGRHSPFWPCESSMYVAETVKDGDVAIFEESGHVPFLEQPDEFNAILGGFLA